MTSLTPEQDAGELKAWPFYGFAPGCYTIHCIGCDTQKQAAKRAIRCLECAIIAAKTDWPDNARPATRIADTAIDEGLRRVRAVANGETINGTYEELPIAALDAFRSDLRAICDELEAKP